MNRASRKMWYFVTQLVFKRQFKNIGSGTVIYKPLQFNREYTISLGKNVYIAEGSWMVGSDKEEDTLHIMDGTTIGHFAHIVGRHSVTIEKNVLLADRVFITDATHEFEDITIPIQKQGMRVTGEVVIGEDSWLGENVAVCGASIGRHCVIGANSVVTHDIPDYSVAVGSPAKVVKRYNIGSGQWERV